MDLLNYVLFYSIPLPEEITEMFKHFLEGKCEKCRKNCPFKGRSSLPVKPIGICDAEDMADMNSFIHLISREQKPEFILLLNREKEKLYLYLGEFDSNLSTMLYYINSMFGKHYSVEDIVDLRETLSFGFVTGVN